MIRVLLVEDNRADARLLEEHLREARSQFELTTVGTLAAGLGAAESHDVILLDLSLPDAMGLATLTRMIDVVRTRPIIVLTGTRDDQTAIDAVAAGAQDYLLKDELTSALVVKTIRYAIERKKAERLERDRAKTSEALTRARLIADVTAAASSSLDLKECLRAVARVLVPRLGNMCSIEVPRTDGSFEQIAWQSDVEGTPRVTVEKALVARGQLVGKLVYGGDQEHGPEDRLVAEEIASRIALAIDNARLFENAQRAVRGRDELLAVVSHDLRNPLGVVDLALALLAQDPGHVANALPRAQRGVDRMKRLIADLLELSRIDAGTLHILPAPTQVSPLLVDVVEQHRPLCAAKGLTLAGDFAGELGTANLDKDRLVQALGNLLGNSIKVTPAGGTITLSATAGEQLVIAVRDTGPGIPAQHLDHIFDRFWQAPEHRAKGVGLGLAIVKGIVDAHRGTVRVQSRVGAGTSFELVLPR